MITGIDLEMTDNYWYYLTDNNWHSARAAAAELDISVSGPARVSEADAEYLSRGRIASARPDEAEVQGVECRV